MSVQAIGGRSLLIPAIVWIGVACGRDSAPVQVPPMSTVAATSPTDLAARVPTPTVEPLSESERAALKSFNATFRDLERTRQSIRDEFETVGVEIQGAEFDQVFAVLDNVIKRQDNLIKEAEGIASWTDDTSRLKMYLNFAYSEELAGYEMLLYTARRAQEHKPTGNPAEVIKSFPGMHGAAKRRFSNAEAYIARIHVLVNELLQGFIATRQEVP